MVGHFEAYNVLIKVFDTILKYDEKRRIKSSENQSFLSVYKPYLFAYIFPYSKSPMHDPELYLRFYDAARTAPAQ